MRENGDRLFALFGLKQNWKLTDKLSLDAGLDRSQTISKSTNYSQAAQTGAISSSTISDDFTAVSVGNSYIEKLWNWNSRLEYRTATSEDKWGILTSFVGEPREGWGSARFQLFDSQTSAGDNKTNADLRLGLAYRPPRTRWIVLDRLDLLFDRQQGDVQ